MVVEEEDTVSRQAVGLHMATVGAVVEEGIDVGLVEVGVVERHTGSGGDAGYGVPGHHSCQSSILLPP